MQNLNFETGLKSYTINNDPNKVVSFDPSDYNIITRIAKASTEIAEISKELSDTTSLTGDLHDQTELDKIASMVSNADKKIRTQIDYIFNAPVSDIAFGVTSCMTTTKGIPLYERFINAVIPIIEREVKAEQKASGERVSKYVNNVGAMK